MLVAKVVTSIMSTHPPISDQVLWGVYTYENIISQLPVFLIGICLFQLSNPKNYPVHQPSINKTYLFIAALIILHLLGGNIFKEHYLFAIAFAFLAFGLSHYPSVILVNRVTIWIGKLSYSIYLVHLLVANLMVKYHFVHFSNNSSLEVLIRFSIILSVSVFISWFTYTLIEKPFISLGKQLIKKSEHKITP